MCEIDTLDRKDNLVVLSCAAGRDLTILATFPFCCAQLFSQPDSRSLRKHPLTPHGLKPHEAFEVQDSAFECVAAGIGVEMIREDDDTIKLMSRRLYM